MAISLLGRLGAQCVSVKDFHIPYTVTPEEVTKAKSEFERAGLPIASGGNIPLQDEDPANLRRYFEYAKRCGMPLMVAAPTHKTLGSVERLAKEFDISVAIHNHGPEDQHFPTPQSVLEAVKGLDRRMGLCMDLGHSLRAGVDVVKTISEAGPRLLDVHMKDLRSATDKGSQCDVGEGVMPVVEIFKQLKANNYRGCVNLEYEINDENPLPGMLHSMGYLRGVLAGLSA
jgi:sugar phosphate isomerase/epimerase